MPSTRKQKPRIKKKVVQTSSSIRTRFHRMEFDEGIKICIYGHSGTGKTRLWGTFPGPIAALISSGSNKSGELRSINTKEVKQKTEVLDITDPKDLWEFSLYQQEVGEFNTVVLDHATSLQDRTLAKILELDKLPEQSSWGIASQQDWGQCSLEMKESLRHLLNLSCNVVIIAQEREFTPTDNESNLITPHISAALSPSVAGWLAPACDYLVQTYKQQKTVTKNVRIGKKTKQVTKAVRGVDYCLRTGPDAVYMTKFRLPSGSGSLPDYIKDPSYDKIIKLIEGGQ